MLYGYTGKLLFVDLTDRSFHIEDLSEEDARNFIGGAALGAKILFDRMPAHTPAFAPESMLGFVTSPANGNAAFLGGRYTVVSKSPVTDGWNDASSGGNFGPQLKRAGFDGVFVTGVSETPAGRASAAPCGKPARRCSRLSAPFAMKTPAPRWRRKGSFG